MGLMDLIGGAGRAIAGSAGVPTAKQAPAGLWDPTLAPQVNNSDRLALVLSAIADGADTLQGRQSGDQLASTQKLILSRAQLADQNRLLGMVMGGGGGASPAAVPALPTSTATPASTAALGPTVTALANTPAAAPAAPVSSGINLQSPAMAALIARNPTLGAALVTLGKAQQPDIKYDTAGNAYNANDPSVLGQGPVANRQAVNNTVVDLNDPNNTNRVLPSEPVKGALPVFDNLGHVVDWKLPAGAANAIGQSSQADATGKTRGSIIDVPNADGSSSPTLGADYLDGGRTAGGGGIGGRGGYGRTQTPGDKEYDTNIGKAEADRFQGIQAAGMSAPSNIAKYQQIGSLLDNFEGGKLTGGLTAISSAANSLGIKVDPKLGNKEASEALANQLALAARSTADGGGMPGAMSDADRNFLKGMTPNMAQTAAGRKTIIQAAVAGEQRKADISAMATAYQQRVGRLDKPSADGKNFYQHLSAWSNTHPLFGKGQ